jgi:tetratricopeptide (TPR) repeat protein
VRYQRGCIWLNQNRIAEAVSAFQEAVESPSSLPSLAAFCYERLGFVELFENRNAEGALDLLARAVDAYPAGQDVLWLAQLHLLRSRALVELQRYAEALSAAHQARVTAEASAQDRRHVSALVELAVGEALAHIAGREEAAVDHLVMFLRMSARPLGVDVTWSLVYETMGDLSLRLRRYEQAVSSYREALALNPHHPLGTTLRYKIARCYYRMGAYGDVVRTLRSMEQAAASDAEPIGDYHVYDVLASALFALKQYASAAEAYRKALALAPAGSDRVGELRLYARLADELNQGNQEL